MRRVLTDLPHAVRASLRRMARSPRFTLTILGIFALGLGANAVVFDMIDRLLLQAPAGLERPDDLRQVLVETRDTPTSEPSPTATLSYPLLTDLRELPGLSGAAAYVTTQRIVGRHGDAYPAQVTQVSGDYFGVLGVGAEVGRPLLPSDDDAAAEPAAVISYGLWQTRFGGETDAVGRTLDLAGRMFTIVGVAPRGFTGANLGREDVWVPLFVAAAGTAMWENNLRFRWLQMVARLESGAGGEAAARRATTAWRARLGVESDDMDTAPSVRLSSIIAAQSPLASGESRVARWLFAVSLLVLVIACANVANLLMARATARSGETGVRLALGASRRRLMLESVCDAVLPATMGAGVALLLAEWGGGLARPLLLPGVAWDAHVVDARLVGFIVALTLLAGIAAGVLTGIGASRDDVRRSMSRATTRTTRRSRTRDGLVVIQTAVSVVLLVGAALFLRSLGEVSGTDLGFEAERLLVARPILDGSLESDDEWASFYEEARERIGALPGVTGVASAAMTTPFGNQLVLDVTRGAEAVPEEERNAYVTNVSPGYFRTLGTRVTAGREIRDTDLEGASPVAVVNEALAGRFWPGESAVGRCLALQGYGEEDVPCIRVVGVAENAKRRSFRDEAVPQVFLPSAQDVAGWGRDDVLFVRAAVAPELLTAPVRAEMIAALPRLRYAEVQPVLALVDPLARPWRLGATMFGLFGLLALAVTAFGLYSLMAFDIARRSSELAIRSALGAPGRRLVGTVISRGVGLSSLGLVLGLVAAALATPLIADLLYGTDPLDPATFGLVAASLIGPALLACWLPARRAIRADPATVMRSE